MTRSEGARSDKLNYTQLALLDYKSLVQHREGQQLLLLNFVNFSPVLYRLNFECEIFLAGFSDIPSVPLYTLFINSQRPS